MIVLFRWLLLPFVFHFFWLEHGIFKKNSISYKKYSHFFDRIGDESFYAFFSPFCYVLAFVFGRLLPLLKIDFFFFKSSLLSLSSFVFVFEWHGVSFHSYSVAPGNLCEWLFRKPVVEPKCKIKKWNKKNKKKRKELDHTLALALTLHWHCH